MRWSRLFPLERVLDKAGTVLGIALVALLANALVRRAAARATNRLGTSERDRRARTLISMLANLAKYTIFGVAAAMVLAKLGVNIGPLLFGAGLAGLAIAFGAQSLVRDLVTGFFLIFENQYGVGELVEINGSVGIVEEVGLRLTRLRSLTGELRFFPNGAVTTITNYRTGGIPYLLSVPPSAPPAPLSQALAHFQDLYQVFARAPEAPLLAAAPENQVLQVRLWVTPTRQGLLEAHLPAYLARALSAQGVELPVEQMVLVSALSR